MEWLPRLPRETQLRYVSYNRLHMNTTHRENPTFQVENWLLIELWRLNVQVA